MCAATTAMSVPAAPMAKRIGCGINSRNPVARCDEEKCLALFFQWLGNGWQGRRKGSLSQEHRALDHGIRAEEGGARVLQRKETKSGCGIVSRPTHRKGIHTPTL